MTTTHVVVTGNPIDGLFFYGPFASTEEAVEWATREQYGQEWWVAELNEPQEEGD